MVRSGMSMVRSGNWASPHYRGFMAAQGWYRDPYGIHVDRWFSDGRPTRLVRDEGVESYDDPPSSEPVEPLVPVPSHPGDNTDTRRADAAIPVDEDFWLRDNRRLGRGIYWMVWNRAQRGK